MKIFTQPVESAKEAGLRYVSHAVPGIQRRTRGKNFVYVFPDGKIIRDPVELSRIKRLAIPPAWTDVWICPYANGHLQATGRDARQRKQYRYHSRWREVRDSAKYDRMIAFGKALPKIRRRVRTDLKLNHLPRAKVVATVVRLLERTLIRVGNDEYARDNHSYGLTTMRNHHAKISGARATFEFYGKGHRRHVISVDDPILAKIVKRCRDLPGHELFQYVDQEGERQQLCSDDVNQYLKEVTGEDFSAKDFRTWSGTVLAFAALGRFANVSSPARAKSHIARAIEQVAGSLGNTPAICKKCYVHPAIIDAYLKGGNFWSNGQHFNGKRALRGLRMEERTVMKLLRAAERTARGQSTLDFHTVARKGRCESE